MFISCLLFFTNVYPNQPLARISDRESHIIYKRTQKTLLETFCTNDSACIFNLTDTPNLKAYGTFVYKFKQFRIRLQYDIPQQGLLKLDISSDPYYPDIIRNHTIVNATLDKKIIASNLSTYCIPFDPKYCHTKNAIKQCYNKHTFPSKCHAESYCISNSSNCENDEL